MSLHCPQCVVLTENVRRREREYNTAKRLLPTRGTITELWREELIAAAEWARIDYQLAETTLRNHQRVHASAN